MDPAVVQCQDSRADRGGGGIVGHQHHSSPGAPPHLAQAIEDPAAGRAIEIPRRLVGEQQRRVGHESARDRDPLHLAARELLRIVGAPLGDPDALEEPVDPPRHVGLASAAEQQRKTNILEDA